MSVIAVTINITVACQLIVRQTWVCLALPIGPLFRSRGMPFHQSMNPVSAAPRLTMKPATITNVAATKKSLALPPTPIRVASEVCVTCASEKNEIRSNTAASV